MAFIADTATSSTETSGQTASFTPTLSSHQADDYLVLCICNDQGQTTLAGWSGSWTEIGTQARNGSHRSTIIYLKASGSSETAPTITGRNDDWVVHCLTVRGADTTTFLDTSAKTDDNSDTHPSVCPSVTTTSADELIIRFISDDIGFAAETSNRRHDPVNVHEATLIANDDMIVQTSVYAQHQKTAGATGTFEWSPSNSSSSVQDSTGYTLAINNDGSTTENQRTISTTNTLLEELGAYDPIEGGMTYGSLHSKLSTINSETVVALATTPSATLQSRPAGSRVVNSTLYNYTTANPAGGNWEGAYWTLSATADLSSSVWSAVLTHKSRNWLDSQGMTLIFWDSSNNWFAFNPVPELSANEAQYRYFLSLPSMTLYDESTTSIDWTDVTHFGIAYRRAFTGTSGTNQEIDTFWLLDGNVTATGGSSSRPITPRWIADSLRPRGELNEYASSQGVGQDVIRFPIQIGDGSTETYFDQSTSSYEWDTNDNNLFYQVDDNSIDLTIYASSNDTFDFSASVTASGQAQSFIIHASSSTSATYNFTGWSCIGLDVTWKTGIDCSNASFINCGIIDAKAATFTSCTIKNSRSTTCAIDIDAGATISDCTFTKGDETYAIEIPSAGAYDLGGNSYTGYTNVLNVSATTGTVTITLDSGDSNPSYVTAGATVTFVNPATTYNIALPNIADSSRFQIYNVTTATELTNSTTSGGTGIDETYTKGTDYSAGDTGRIRVTYVNGTSAYKEYSTTFTFSSDTTVNSIPYTQESDSVYDGYAVDGSSITKFSADYTNDEIDVVSTSNFTGEEFYAWWTYNTTTSNGIANFFGAVQAIDAGNIKIDDSTVDVMWDNTTTTNVHQTDSIRIHRDDGAYPVVQPTSGGGGIDLNWKNQVYLESTGSGLSASQNTTLNTIATQVGDNEKHIKNAQALVIAGKNS